MAIVAVTADNTRLEDAESGTGWNNIGGGAGGAAEGSFPYQGNNLYNRKVTGTSGFYYDPTADAGSAISMISPTNSTWMVKAIVSDYAGLNAVSGLRVRIGSATSAFHQFVISGTNAKIPSLAQYPARGGLIIIPINPNIAAFRDATTGSPTLSAVDYFGLEANFDSSTAKSENVGLDAIDLGRGLTLVGGDGADPDAVWQDFVDADEGTNANRWGFASSTFDEVKLFYGSQQVGSKVATVFTDLVSQILWLDGLFQAGWSKGVIDLTNSLSSIVDGATHTGLGSTAIEDSRPNYIVLGKAGLHTFSGVLNNFSVVEFSPSSSVTGATIEASKIDHGNATIHNTSIKTKTATQVAAMKDVSKTEEYAYTNGTSDIAMYPGNNAIVGQAFTAEFSGEVESITLWLDKVGSPVGTCTVEIKNAQNTVGTNATPTSPSLATSSAVDVSTFPTRTTAGLGSKTPVVFTFPTPVSLIAGNDYTFELINTHDNASNHVTVLVDNNSPAHPGNFFKIIAAYSPDATIDMVFRLDQRQGFGNISNLNFVQGQNGHAIEITKSGTYTLDNIKYTDYGGVPGSNLVANTGEGDAAIYNNSGGLVTLNVVNGGDTPTVRNGVGATTIVSNPSSFKFTVNPSITGYEWRVYAVTAVGSLAGAVELAGEEVATADNQTYTYEYVSDQPIAIQIIALAGDYVEKIEYNTLTAASKDVTINLSKDNNN